MKIKGMWNNIYDSESMIGDSSMATRGFSTPRSVFHAFPEVNTGVHSGTATGDGLGRQGGKRKREVSEDDSGIWNSIHESESMIGDESMIASGHSAPGDGFHGFSEIDNNVQSGIGLGQISRRRGEKRKREVDENVEEDGEFDKEFGSARVEIRQAGPLSREDRFVYHYQIFDRLVAVASNNGARHGKESQNR